jgi:hypothetical protein
VISNRSKGSNKLSADDLEAVVQHLKNLPVCFLLLRMTEFILLLPTLKMTQTSPGKISSAANMITDILSCNRPDFPLNWQATEHMPKIAWKTGTVRDLS